MLQFQFIELPFGNINARLWDFGDGNTSTEANPLHEYATAGQYLVSLTVFGDDCKAPYKYLSMQGRIFGMAIWNVVRGSCLSSTPNE
ncbi:MAG: PKD domain-containing protein [Saprospiraceae bacterium]